MLLSLRMTVAHPALTPAADMTFTNPVTPLAGSDPLDLHNRYRAYNHAPAMSWSSALQVGLGLCCCWCG
jgi:hypothetical protein